MAQGDGTESELLQGEAAKPIGRGLSARGQVAAQVADAAEPPAAPRPQNTGGLARTSTRLGSGVDPEAEARALAEGQVDERDAEREELLAPINVKGFGKGAQRAAGTAERQLKTGTGGAKKVGTLTQTFTSAAPAEEIAQQQANQTRLAQVLSAQASARAQGWGLSVDVWRDIVEPLKDTASKQLVELNEIFDRADKQLYGIQRMADDVRARRINPGQFFANVGDAGTFAASMAVAAGHLASAVGGGPNTALSIINGAIERNMQAQRLNQSHDQFMLGAQVEILDQIRGLGTDRINADNAYKEMLLAHAQAELEGISAATASVEERLNVGKILAELSIAQQKTRLDYFGAIQAKVQMDLSSSTSMAQRVAQANAVGRQAIQQQGGVAPGGTTQRAPSAGGAPGEVAAAGGGRRGGGARALPGDGGRGDAAAQGIIDRLAQGETPLRADVAEAEILSAQVSGDFTFSDKTLDRMRREIPVEGGGTLADHALTADLRPLEQGEGIRVDFSGGRGESIGDLRPSAQFKKLKDADQLKMGNQLQAQADVVDGFQRLFELADSGAIARSEGLLTFDDGEWRFLGGGATEEAKEVQNTLNKLVILQNIAERGDMEAIQGKGEWGVLMRRALIPDDNASLLSIATKNSDAFRTQIIPGLKQAKRLQRTWLQRWTDSVR